MDIKKVMRDEEGGNAFPSKVNGPDDSKIIFSGMSMLEYYAARAMKLFSFDASEVVRLQSGESPNHALMAGVCFDVAEAMVAEATRRREKKD